MTNLLPRLALIASAFILASCSGYQIGTPKPANMQHVRVIAVPNVKNDTLEPRIDVLLTNSIISRMQEDGTFETAREDKADAILQARILRIDRRQLRSARFNTLRSRELGVAIIVEYSVIDSTTQQLLRRGQVRGDTSVFIDANYQNAERQAFPEAADRAAAQIVSRISEGW